MVAHWDIVQGTEEWHRIRYRKIGGSTSKGLFVDSDTLLDQLIGEHLEEFELSDGYESADMQRGTELEPVARQKLVEYTSIPFIECGWLQSDISVLGISPDGITKDLKFACEIKCPAPKKHVQSLRGGGIPLDNIHQCVHYFTVIPTLERLYFESFRPESKFPMFIRSIGRQSVVNLGTKAKPVWKTVNEWAAIARGKAISIESSIESEIKRLEF